MAKKKNKGTKGKNQNNKSSGSTTSKDVKYQNSHSKGEPEPPKSKGNESCQKQQEVKNDNEVVTITENTVKLECSNEVEKLSKNSSESSNNTNIAEHDHNKEQVLNKKGIIDKMNNWRIVHDTDVSRENTRVSNDDSADDAWGGFKNKRNRWDTKEKPTSSKIENWREKNENDECGKEFDVWEKQSRKEVNFNIVKEIEGDLFQQPADNSLAHCVAADLRMGSGIAVGFKQQFKNLDTLLDQRVKQGGVAILPDEKNKRYIYYLVTKKESTGKPTYNSLWKSLWKMREHIVLNQVKKLALPRIGCGLDRLEWDVVKNMLEYLFKDGSTEITVCNFQEMEATADSQSAPKKQMKTCRLMRENYHLTAIAEGTAIMYLTTEKGDPDEIMKDLDAKFNFLSKARVQYSSKRLGECIIVEDKQYVFFGCIVRKSNKEPISFESLKKCIQAFNKKNKSYGNDCFYYVGFQEIKDTESYQDTQINEKVITLLTNTLRDVDVYFCTGIKDRKY
ncbi:uncharacterized protein LOC143203879 isoform X1 [Rhynchophorus ferrugineus]|uniref:uncharacterized protein LOC143203879 isoform X1 n=1 Tax=Rhynchophorus ferrugineus TaxID=354439 RepID=UPI003FCC4AE4